MKLSEAIFWGLLVLAVHQAVGDASWEEFKGNDYEDMISRDDLTQQFRGGADAFQEASLLFVKQLGMNQDKDIAALVENYCSLYKGSSTDDAGDNPMQHICRNSLGKSEISTDSAADVARAGMSTLMEMIKDQLCDYEPTRPDRTATVDIPALGSSNSLPDDVGPSKSETLGSLCAFPGLDDRVTFNQHCAPKTCASSGASGFHCGKDGEVSGYSRIDVSKRCFANQHIREHDPIAPIFGPRPGVWKSGFVSGSMFYDKCSCGGWTSSQWKLSTTPLIGCNHESLSKHGWKLVKDGWNAYRSPFTCFKGEGPSDFSNCHAVFGKEKVCACYFNQYRGKGSNTKHMATLITKENASELWGALKKINTRLGCSVFMGGEGLEYEECTTQTGACHTHPC